VQYGFPGIVLEIWICAGSDKDLANGKSQFLPCCDSESQIRVRMVPCCIGSGLQEYPGNLRVINAQRGQHKRRIPFRVRCFWICARR